MAIPWLNSTTFELASTLYVTFSDHKASSQSIVTFVQLKVATALFGCNVYAVRSLTHGPITIAARDDLKWQITETLVL